MQDKNFKWLSNINWFYGHVIMFRTSFRTIDIRILLLDNDLIFYQGNFPIHQTPWCYLRIFITFEPICLFSRNHKNLISWINKIHFHFKQLNSSFKLNARHLKCNRLLVSTTNIWPLVLPLEVGISPFLNFFAMVEFFKIHFTGQIFDRGRDPSGWKANSRYS